MGQNKPIVNVHVGGGWVGGPKPVICVYHHQDNCFSKEEYLKLAYFRSLESILTPLTEISAGSV